MRRWVRKWNLHTFARRSWKRAVLAGRRVYRGHCSRENGIKENIRTATLGTRRLVGNSRPSVSRLSRLASSAKDMYACRSEGHSLSVDTSIADGVQWLDWRAKKRELGNFWKWQNSKHGLKKMFRCCRFAPFSLTLQTISCCHQWYSMLMTTSTAGVRGCVTCCGGKTGC